MVMVMVRHPLTCLLLLVRVDTRHNRKRPEETLTRLQEMLEQLRIVASSPAS
jgi:hypothetical protein